MDFDLEKLTELMESMKDKGFTGVTIKEKDGREIRLEREEKVLHPSPYPGVALASPPPQVEVTPTPQPLPHKEEEGEEKSKGGEEITSPMVGTFYVSPSPEDEPFVKVGDRVTEETVICIIEAMKVMNEVKAGKAGAIAEAYVNNGQPVEFGSKLFRIV